MEITLLEKLGEGGFGDVYKGLDALGRQVAVKIIRSSAAMVSTALDHARALGRVSHPNVVAVYSIEKVQDPDTGLSADAVVMELLEGDTLFARLRHGRFALSEVGQVCRGLWAGIHHIHSQGLTHGDLHSENVILVGPNPKVIDILYRDSLALLSNASRETRVRKDILNLRVMLYDVLLTSELDPADAAEFNASLSSQPSLEEIKNAFEAVVDPTRRGNDELRIEQSIHRIRDESFLGGDSYARALAQETPSAITKQLLGRIIEERGLGKKHRAYLRLLWDRLIPSQQRQTCRALGEVLNKEIPSGHWGSPLQLLAAFGKDGWGLLPELVQLRLEGAIVSDILAGHHDIYGLNVGTPGALGTYANVFWPNFRDRDRLVDNIVARLNSGWYGQNYVGMYLLPLAPLIGDTETRKTRLIEAIRYAVRNDAKVVSREIASLPGSWQEAVNSGGRPGVDDTPLSVDDDDIPFL